MTISTVPFLRAMAMLVFLHGFSWFHMLSVVAIALFLTIRPQFAIKYLRRSKSTEGGSFCVKILGCFLLTLESVVLGQGAHRANANLKIIFLTPAVTAGISGRKM